MADLELISLNLTAQYLSVDSELQLFRKILNYLKNKIERSVYNRKRNLAGHMEVIRRKLAMIFNEYENIFITDNMPLKVCEFSRASPSKICREHEYFSPEIGYCSAQKTQYYGYKLHVICLLEGVIQSFDLSPMSVHDVNYLKDVREQLQNCTLITDRGYISAEYQIDLFNYANIQLDIPKRSNQKDYKPQFRLFKKHRKRIETLFSQLCDQFMTKRNYAKTFGGFKLLIISKLIVVRVIQYMNKFLFNRNLNSLKASII